ncbi:ParB-like nuclease family protein [Anaerobacterium chartisolvens]|uniref:ParB-like nuclease family protein n=1 Tax=Anaerobacterium chartisolvens TaxID=1297424 RepID=A0A369BHW2_9FIRM|nr:ParB N-terminal domain-containing protein [Anaerobacterium chartisolvens]RCX20855.1 ParB-like nuclease family protein [Anaerobacterium chartisolvens]
MREYQTEYGVFTVPDFPKIKTKKGEVTLPVMCPMLVPKELVVANNYNPNHVPDNNMKLLETSILRNGFCYAVVTAWDEDTGKFVVEDGFHRDTILNMWLDAEYIPIIVQDHTPQQRMEATVQFNRARGVHQVELMGDLVQALINQGASDEEISKHLGMEMEEVYRLKQITGIAELFKNQIYSKSWIMQEVEENA